MATPAGLQAELATAERRRSAVDDVTTIHFDELDPFQMLHNTRYAVFVERATAAFFRQVGRTWELEVERKPDQFHVVKAFSIKFPTPFLGTGQLTTSAWVEQLGNSSCTYAFRCSSGDGGVVHAIGRRTVLKLDPHTLRPVPWTDWFRQAHGALLLEDRAE